MSDVDLGMFQDMPEVQQIREVLRLATTNLSAGKLDKAVLLRLQREFYLNTGCHKIIAALRGFQFVWTYAGYSYLIFISLPRFLFNFIFLRLD